jgi:DNA-binding HxlR family transcriptional regulator
MVTMKADELEPFCPHYHRAVELIGRRWTGAILRAMLVGRCRFSELAQTIPGLSQRMLSERLKELEAEGVVVRSVTPSVPVRVEYHLTEKGQSLSSVIGAVATWAEQWADQPGEGVAVSPSAPAEVES